MTAPSRPWAVLGVVAVGTFMSALGGSLINVAVPIIRRDLGADVGQASWVLAAYSLAVSSLLLAFGRLGDLWDRRRVYTLGFLVFGAGAGLCALAPTLATLVAARALQGVGAAMLMSNGPALTTAAFPPAQRGRALGLQATATYTGLTAGPSVGGALAGRFGWHAAFLVALPVALVGAALAHRILPTSRPAEGQSFPWPSALLFGAALTAVLVAVTRGEAWGWTAAPVLGLFTGGLALLAGFTAVERRSARPMIPTALLRDRVLVGGLGAAFLQYLAAYMLLFLLPFHLQGVLGESTAEAGTMMTLQPAVMAVVTAGAGWLSDRVGTRWPASVGMVALALGLARVATLGPGAGTAALLGGLALVGLGSGLFTSPNNSSIMGAAPPSLRGTAAGLLAEARNVGMLAGIAASSTLFAVLGGGRLFDRSHAGTGFAPAFRGTLLVAAGLAAAGALLSALRPGAPAPTAPSSPAPPTGTRPAAAPTAT